MIEISAASIIAKVYRDYLMEEYAKKEDFKLWNFAKHKGYATATHQELIRLHGASSIHRLSFLKNIIQ